MTVRKSKDLEFIVNEKTSEFGNINTNFYTEDKGNASIRMRLKYENSYVNLEEINMRPQLDLFHSDGSIWMDENLIMVLPEYGLIQYSIPDNVIKHKGKVTAKLFLVNQNKSIHVANFNFSIQDSGIDDIVEKEISIKLVDDTIRQIIKENSLELLDDDFKDKLLTDTKEYLSSNPDKFKGPKGDDGLTGPKGDTGERGERGSQGEHGFQGDKGPQGERGPQGLRGERGATGYSAYELAVKNGFKGSEQEWLSKTAKGTIGDLIINFDEYNPDKTGSTDVSPMLQDAFNRIKNAGSGTVNISEGEYLINSRVIIYGNTTLNMTDNTILSRGETHETLMNASYDDVYTEYNGNSNINIIGGIFYSNYAKLDKYPTETANQINLMHAENITIKNVTFRDTLSYHSLDVNGVRGLTVENCTFEGYAKLKSNASMKEAIQLSEYISDSIAGSGAYDGTPCRDIFIINCTFKPSADCGAPDVGIGNHTSLYGVSQTNINLIGNTFIDCNVGARPYKWSDFRLENNNFIGCYQAVRISSINGTDKSAQKLDGAVTNLPQAGKNYIIKGNIFKECKSSGIGIYGQRTGDIEARVTNIIISNNTFESSNNTNTTSEALVLNQTDDVQINGNSFKGFSRNINYKYCDKVFIFSNIFKQCEKESLFNNSTEYSGKPSVSNVIINDNYIEDARYNYIYLQDGENITVKDNTFNAFSTEFKNIRSRGGIYGKNINGLLTRNNNFININREYSVKFENTQNARLKEETDIFNVYLNGNKLS